nr:Chain B, Peptide from Nuclear receptor coactivator 2 [Homo sapiens]5YXL_D Chain D, Peptide from Nuclear receptor coactivator 2 [Homo sapiens]
ALLRYLLD